MTKKDYLIFTISAIIVMAGFYIVQAANTIQNGLIIGDGSVINFLPSGYISSTTYTGNVATATYAVSVATAANVLNATQAVNADTVDGWHRDDILAWGNKLNRPEWLGNSASYIDYADNANTWYNSGFYQNYNGLNWPTSGTWYNMINVRHSNQSIYYGFQIAMPYWANDLYFRSYNNGVFQPWAQAISSANIGTQNVNYVASAGNVSSAISASSIMGFSLNQSVQTGASPTFAGLTINGNVIILGTPTLYNHVVTKAYVDSTVPQSYITSHLTNKKISFALDASNKCKPASTSTTTSDYYISDFDPVYSGTSTRINSGSLSDTNGNGFKESALLAAGKLGLDTGGNIIESTVTPSLRSEFKCIFVSSATYTGNLGGVAGADAKCQTLATAAGLSGSYKAWVSTASSSAGTRLSHASIPYKRPDGLAVFNNWDHLVSSANLYYNIERTEQNNTVNTYVYTQTNRDGSFKTGGGPCTGNDWTNTGNSANVGHTSYNNAGWTMISPPSYMPCSYSLPIYCLEQ